MQPRLHFGGPAAADAFLAQGSQWSAQAWVRLKAINEDLEPLLIEANRQLPEDHRSRMLVTFDFPDQRDGEPGFQAKLWLPESIEPLPAAADSPALSLATAPQGLQPSDDEMLRSISGLEPLFAQGKLDKVVLAQRLRTESPTAWVQPSGTDAMVWTLNLEDSGRAFYAKSPEALLRWQGDHVQSMALAGTVGRSPDPEEDGQLGQRLLASEKDRREHMSVVAHIRQHLEHYCERLGPPMPPELIQLPGLQHLCTRLHARGPQIHPLLLAAMLHPTPALCGEPRLEALRYLQSVERFPRGLYGGVIGWFSRSAGALIVGLRAIQQREDHLELIAGAGCVPGSSPRRELAEIHLKRETILAEAGLHLA